MKARHDGPGTRGRANGVLLASTGIAIVLAVAFSPSSSRSAPLPASPMPLPFTPPLSPVSDVHGGASADSERARRVLGAVQVVLERGRLDGAYPGAQAVVGTRDGILAHAVVGTLDWSPSPAPDERTLWDLASLTKVVALTASVMALVSDGRLELEAPVQRYLPEWSGRGKEAVLVHHLLTHSSGLPSWRPFFRQAATPEGALALVLATPLDTLPGARYVYSDIGAILLGKVVERVSGESLDRYLTTRVLGPLGMRETRFRPEAADAARTAPTEVDPWRGRHLRGEVHDENAYALGGVSGHAGLFSTAVDLSRFARALLGGGALDGVQVFAPATVAAFTTVVEPAFSHRALGWETPTGGNSAGRRLSPRAFGHTGFTGTSLWIDPERDLFVLLLSNRVNPTRENSRIGRVRAALADAVVSAADDVSPAASLASPPAPPSPEASRQ